MTRRQMAGPALLVFFAATRAAAQTAPAPSPAEPSGEPTVPAPPDTPPGIGQPPPAPPPAESTKAAPAPSPGEVIAKWTMTVYGFAEFDIMHDTTQSFSDSPGNGMVQRPESLTYRNGRTQTTARNSRFGVRLSAPEANGIRASANLEMDFMGNQPNTVSEASFVNNGTFRLRAAYAKVETDYVDALAGQHYFVFAHQPFFFPMSISFFGLPNMAFGRAQQLRLTRIVKTDAANVEIVAAALRPPQRDSARPDLQGGLKIGFNSWKGPHTIGSGYPSVDPLSIGISGAARRYRVNEFAAAPSTTNDADGWGVSIDGMIPVIPGTPEKKGNALTLTGSFVIGHGIGDLLGGLSGGAVFPCLDAPDCDAPPYPANIDNGLVQYDADGNLRTLDWQTFMAGIQYYLPPNGQVTVAANYTQGDADNITEGLSGADMGRVMKKSQFFETTVLADITPAVRAGAAWQRIHQTRGDDMETTNNRFELSVYFFF